MPARVARPTKPDFPSRQGIAVRVPSSKAFPLGSTAAAKQPGQRQNAQTQQGQNGRLGDSKRDVSENRLPRNSGTASSVAYLVIPAERVARKISRPILDRAVDIAAAGIDPELHGVLAVRRVKKILHPHGDRGARVIGYSRVPKPGAAEHAQEVALRIGEKLQIAAAKGAVDIRDDKARFVIHCRRARDIQRHRHGKEIIRAQCVGGRPVAGKLPDVAVQAAGSRAPDPGLADGNGTGIAVINVGDGVRKIVEHPGGDESGINRTDLRPSSGCDREAETNESPNTSVVMN